MTGHALGRAGRLALTPVAIMEGMAFAATVFGNKPSKPVYELVRLSPRPTAPLADPEFPCWKGHF